MKEQSNLEKLDQGELRIPLSDLSDHEFEIAWLGCVMSKYIAEKDFNEQFYYSLNPEKPGEPERFHWTPLIEERTRSPLQGEFILVRKWDNKIHNLV